MIVKLNLMEMFVVYTLLEKVELLSHRIAVKKLISQFMDDMSFGELVELKDLVNKNFKAAQMAHAKEIQALRKDLLPHLGKKIPSKILEKQKTLDREIQEKALVKNRELEGKFDDIVEKDKEPREIQMTELGKKAILNYAMSDDLKVKDLSMSNDAIEALSDICIKLEA